MALTESRRPTAPQAAAPERTAATLPPVTVLFLVAVLLPIGAHAGSLALTGLRLLLLALMVPMLVRLFTGRAGRVMTADWLLIGFTLWTALALAITTPDQALTQTGSVGVETLGGYLVGRLYIRNASAFLAFSRLVVWSVLLLGPFAVYEVFAHHPPILEALEAVHLSAVQIVEMIQRLGLRRAQVVFSHPIHWGVYGSLAFSMSFIALRQQFGFATRMLVTGAIVVLAACSLSSGALLAIVLQVALLAWGFVLRPVPQRWWILIGLLAAFYLAIDLVSNRTPLQVFMSYATLDPQTAYWRSLILEWGSYNVAQHPMFGIGFNDWVRPAWMYTPSVDNFWLLRAMRFGLPGLVLLVGFFVAALAPVVRARVDEGSETADIRRAWLFAMFGLCFALTTVDVWTNVQSYVFFLVGAGLWLAAPEAAPDGPEAGLPAEAPAAAAKAGPRFSRFAPRPGRRAP